MDVMVDAQTLVPARRAGRPPRSAEDGKAAILRGALEEFASAGFKGASISAIAKRAGVARPLVLYHFKSKDDLWRQAVGLALDRQRADVMTIAQTALGLEPEALLRLIARRAVAFAADYPTLARIVVDETGKPGPRGAWLIEHHVAPLYEMAGMVVTAMNNMPGAPFGRLDAAHMLPSLLGLMNVFFLEAPVLKKVLGLDPFEQAAVERHGEFVAELLTRGLLRR